MTYGIRALIAMGFALCLADGAEAIPAFAQQTGQACSVCHVGAFGPQLKPYGRDFKLYGYTASDGQKHLPPVALTLQTSFTHTVGDQDSLVAQGLKPNDNFIADEQVSAYYGGRLGYGIGAFIQVTYEGAAASTHWDNLDIRYAHPTQLFGQDTVFGITVNNDPTIEDLWNSPPGWGFPYNSSSIAPSGAAATLVDGALAQEVVGAGAYAMWNDLLYVEGSVYRNLSPYMLERLGVEPAGGEANDSFGGGIPYGRIALEHATDNHYFQTGAFTLAADRYPGGDRSTGRADHIVDRAVDANYQYLGNSSHFLSVHAVYIHEDENLPADQILNGTLANDTLHTFRTDMSYSFRDTWTPSVQYFRTGGSRDAALWGTTNGSPDTHGYIAEIAYVPLGKPKSAIQWMNVRVAAQYVSYQVFDGSASGSSKNNTLYLSVWFAVAPLYGVEKNLMPSPATHQ